MQFSYRIAPSASRDMLLALDYLHERNPSSAKALSSAFKRKIELLARYPFSGKLYESTTHHRGIRFGVVGSYQIFYIIRQNYIEIVRVLHHARDITLLLH